MRTKIDENKISIRKIKSSECPVLHCIYSRNPFFENRVSIEINENYIVFKREYMEDIGKTYKPSRPKNSDIGYTINIRESIAKGMFEINKEESNEDELVVYFN
ncbi:MAG: hypothetical protein ACE1ZQ_09400 [Ignavibacteriaceae bacterium]